jgi:hypothetical protein
MKEFWFIFLELKSKFFLQIENREYTNVWAHPIQHPKTWRQKTPILKVIWMIMDSHKSRLTLCPSSHIPLAPTYLNLS